MTRNEFLIICGDFNLDPGIALENENVVKAIREDDKDNLKEVLTNEF
jgi:hypothetical protein